MPERPAGPADPGEVFAWLDVLARSRELAGLRRRPRPRTPDSPLLDLAGNDYLGLARHPETVAAAAGAVQDWGVGSTGSRLVTGSTSLHAELEEELAEFCGTPAALVFSSGYLANLAMLTTLSTKDTLIVSDAHNHASLIDGCRLSRAEVAVVPHADPGAVRAALAERTHPRAMVVTDSVFSVDGDLAPLPELASVAREHGAALVVDDAHGFGVLGPTGRGALAQAGLAGAPDVVFTVTLSKSLGAQGGAVLGSERVVRQLAETARPFLFDTGLAPGCAAGALAALRVLRGKPGLAERARTAAAGLAARLHAAGVPASVPAAAVVSVPAAGREEAMLWARRCRENGVSVGCFRPPSVPDGLSRLRLAVRADLTEDELDHAVEVIVSTEPSAVLSDLSAGFREDGVTAATRHP